MTENASIRQRVRERAAKTGESYPTARRHVVAEPRPATVVIAVAQTALRPDPRSRAQLRESGARVRELVREAAGAGAALVQFPEGALTSPHRRAMSGGGPGADWPAVDRAALAAELDAVAETARELGIWVVAGGIDFAGDDPRPTNALFVISAHGALAGRYDERMLSRTKTAFQYRAGTRPFVFEARGARFGCALGMETQYPELFSAYERADVDCVLLSTAGNPEVPGGFVTDAAGHAAANSFWVGYSGPAQAGEPPSGVLSPSGTWVARCAPATEGIVVTVIDTALGDQARSWRRAVRAAAAGHA
ncbi:carbon-nitrogen hydrolase family protein [Amycolatopsis sp. NPDC051128]|uniref:carbon-nitrogen hydrolase family protein n=1 Tax=Amycolatopsis sp. NPDC051128 TaxID=3155412 RepID=UPI00344397B9